MDIGLYLILAFALSGVSASAQGDATPPANTGGRESAGSAQRPMQRADDEKTAAAKTPAAEVETEDEPPQPEKEAGGSDRLSALRAQIKDAKSEAERTRLRRTLIDYLLALNQKREAIDELRLMMKEERFDPVGFYNIGNALARLGETDAAVEAYRKAIDQRRGYYSRALNNLGVVLLRQGRWDEAREALLSALKQESYRYPEASYNLGRLYSLRGEAALAIREWSRTLSLQPDHTDAAIALARAYAEDGNPERAISVIDSFTARRGANNQLAAARREILYGAGGSDAVAAQKTSAAAKPTTAAGGATIVVPTVASSVGAVVKPASGSNSNGGASAQKTKAAASNSRPALSSSLRSLTVDRETYDLLERARAAREAGKDQEAVGFYNRVLARRGGFFPPANLEISFVLTELNRREEAIASLQKLIAKEGARYPIAYFYLGRQYEALGQLGLAAEAYGRAAAAHGESEPQFLLDVSRVREKEGNIEAALSAMEEYARLSDQRGHTPEWTAGRIAELRRKRDAATTPVSKP